MKIKNKIVHFWIRLFVRFIDFLVIFILSTVFLPFVVERKNNVWFLRNNLIFYGWIFYSIFLFIFFLIIIPSFWKGQSIASSIFRTKVITLKDSLWKAICKREIVGAWGFVLIMLSFGLVLNHTMILKIVNVNELENLSSWENLRLSLATTLASFVIILQMIVAISSLVRKDKQALNDLYANTKFVYINRFIKMEQKQENIIINPKFVKDEPIDWIK